MAYRRSIMRRTFGNAPNIICVPDQLCPEIASGAGIHPLEFSDPCVPAAKSFSISENQTTFCSRFGKWKLIRLDKPLRLDTVSITSQRTFAPIAVSREVFMSCIRGLWQSWFRSISVAALATRVVRKSRSGFPGVRN